MPTPFVLCPICNVPIHAQSLEIHINRNHQQRTSLVTCPICKVIIRRDRLSRHNKKAHTKKPIIGEIVKSGQSKPQTKKQIKTVESGSSPPKTKRRSIEIGSHVYAKLGKESPERMFTVIKIIDESLIEIEGYEGDTHTIDYRDVHARPTAKKSTPPESPSKSVRAISIPMGGKNK